MLYIALNSEAKTHVLSDVRPGPDSRIVTTACGLVHPEPDFLYSTEDDSDLCAKCGGKVEEVADEVTPVDTTPEVVVESDEEEAPRTYSSVGRTTDS